MVDRAVALYLVGDAGIAAVEKQDAELLARLEGLDGAQVVDHGRRRSEGGAAVDLLAL